MHASLPALAAARAAHIAAACLHTPRIAERRLPLGPVRKPEATRVRADQDHLFRGGPWHALSSLARAHAHAFPRTSARAQSPPSPHACQSACAHASTRPRQRSSMLHASLSLPVACPRPAPRALRTPREHASWWLGQPFTGLRRDRLTPRIGSSGIDGYHPHLTRNHSLGWEPGFEAVCAEVYLSKGAACATGRALPPLAQSQLAGIPRFEAVCVRGVRHPLPQGEWHAAPSYTWGSKRLNASMKRVSSGGLPPTPTWSQRRDWTRIVGASLRSRARRRRLLRRLRPCRRALSWRSALTG